MIWRAAYGADMSFDDRDRLVAAHQTYPQEDRARTGETTVSSDRAWVGFRLAEYDLEEPKIDTTDFERQLQHMVRRLE